MFFKTTPHRATKSAGTSKSMSIPSNTNRAKASPSKPAPLVHKCASCGRKSR